MKTEEFDHDLVLTFYGVFCQFENALKKAGFSKDGHPAQADWDRFTRSIEAHFDPNEEPEIIGSFVTLLDFAYKHVSPRIIKGAIRDIALVAEIIQKMGNDLTRGSILRGYTDTEYTAMVAAMAILPVWAGLEPNVKRIWETP